MKKTILSAFMLALAAWGYAQQTQTQPQAETQTGERTEWLPSFTGVDVSAPLDITFVKVPDTQAPRIIYDTKGSYTTKFKAEVKDKVLRIVERPDSRRPERTKVTVEYNELRTIAVSDAAAVFESPLDMPMLDLTVGGRASVKATLGVKDLMIDLSGNSVATLTGKAQYLTASVSSGKLEALQLETTSAQVNATTGGVATVWATDRFEGKTSTNGKISFKGNPAIIRGGSKFLGGDIVHIQ